MFEVTISTLPILMPFHDKIIIKRWQEYYGLIITLSKKGTNFVSHMIQQKKKILLVLSSEGKGDSDVHRMH